MNANAQTKALIDDYLAKQPAIELIALATTDGFNVFSHKKAAEGFEEDKMAAAASTIYSVSDAVAKQILGKSFVVTFIETEAGNVAFVSLEINHADYVLTMSANADLNIASLRLLIKRLANELTNQ